MDDALLETWIATVNETGTEYGLTLMVGGTVITGHLTPMVRYRDWLREVGRRATVTRSRQNLPGGGIGPITEQQAERARAEWEANPLPAEEADPSTRFCLRDAAIASPTGQDSWTHLPFLVVRLSAVQAFSPVRLKA